MLHSLIAALLSGSLIVGVSPSSAPKTVEISPFNRWIAAMQASPTLPQAGFGPDAVTLSVENETSLLAKAGAWDDFFKLLGFTLGEFTLFVQSSANNARVGCPTGLQPSLIANPWDCQNGSSSFLLAPGAKRALNAEVSDLSLTTSSVTLWAGPTGDTAALDYFTLIALSLLDFAGALEVVKGCIAPRTPYAWSPAWTVVAALAMNLGGTVATIVRHLINLDFAAAWSAAAAGVEDLIDALAGRSRDFALSCGGAKIGEVLERFAKDWIKKVAWIAMLAIAGVNVVTFFVNVQPNIGDQERVEIALAAAPIPSPASSASSSPTDFSSSAPEETCNGPCPWDPPYPPDPFTATFVPWSYSSCADQISTSLSSGRPAMLTGCSFYNVDLSGLDLRKAQLSDAYIEYSNLRGTNLSGANLSGATISATNLISANLTGVDFTGAFVTCSVFENAKLKNAINFAPIQSYPTQALGRKTWFMEYGGFPGLEIRIDVLGVDAAIAYCDQLANWSGE